LAHSQRVSRRERTARCGYRAPVWEPYYQPAWPATMRQITVSPTLTPEVTALTISLTSSRRSPSGSHGSGAHCADACPGVAATPESRWAEMHINAIADVPHCESDPTESARGKTMRLIPTWVHGILDYLTVGALLAVPRLVGWNKPATTTLTVAAGGLL